MSVASARRDRIPRWLVEIRRLDRFWYLSDVPGTLPNSLELGPGTPLGPVGWESDEDGGSGDEVLEIDWAQGILDVDVSQTEVALEEMSMPLASATVHLTPDMRRFFNPMTILAQARVRISYYDGKHIRTPVFGDVAADSISIGFDGDPVSFRVVESWWENENFPPVVVEVPSRVDEDKVVEDAEDRAYTQVFGNAFAAPAFPLRHLISDEPTRYMFCDRSINGPSPSAADKDPAPTTGFPQDSVPDVSELRPNSVRGLFYGPNRVLRDVFEKVGLSKGWLVFEGTFAQNEAGSTQLESTTNDSTLRWKRWTYSDTLSIAFRVTPIDASAIACFYWNHVDADNHARVEFPFGGAQIRFVVMENGVATTDESRELEGGIGTDTCRMIVDIAEGKLSCGVREKGSEVGATMVDFDSVSASVGGRIAIGSKAGKIRWLVLAQPSKRSKQATLADANFGIRHFHDLQGRTYVGEGYSEQLGEDLSVVYYQAQNVNTVGQLVDKLIRDYSGVTEIRQDLRSLIKLKVDLNRFRVGAYFNEPEPLFDLIARRLGKQFNFIVTQEGGKVKGFVFDPTLPPERKLVFGVDLLELHEPIGEYTKFTRFRVRYRYFAPKDRWRKRLRKSRRNSIFLRSHEARYGKRPFPRVDLPDVQDDGTAEQLIYSQMLMFHAGQRVVYLQRATEGGDIQLGEVVELEDPARGWVDKRAFFVGRQIISPSYVANVFRTIEFFEEAGASGGAFTLDEEGQGQAGTVVDSFSPFFTEEWDMTLDPPDGEIGSPGESWET